MIDRNKQKTLARARRQRRVRAKVRGTAEKPRLSAFRSVGHIYAQLIDDDAGKTIAGASDLEIEKKDLKGLKKSDVATQVGKLIAEKGKKKGIEKVVFDRNGFAYTGRIAALADGAREGGLKF
jgi:large subunit ribosomal protein L18